MRNRNGFSVIELLVTISIIGILISGLITYNHSAERQLILTKERAQLVDTLNRAKAMSLNAFAGVPGDAPCGVGVHFDDVQSEYVIFLDRTSNCERGPGFGRFSPGEEFEQYIKIDDKIELTSLGNSVGDVFFAPPDPRVFFDNTDVFPADKNDFASYELAIRSAIDSKVYVVVNSAGQISYCAEIKGGGECENN